MIVEQRTYTFVTGGLPEYLRAFEAGPRALQARILGQPLGLYRTEFGALNELISLWGFDSLAERARRRAELMADPDFTAFRQSTRHLIVRQDNRLLESL